MFQVMDRYGEVHHLDEDMRFVKETNPLGLEVLRPIHKRVIEYIGVEDKYITDYTASEYDLMYRIEYAAERPFGVMPPSPRDIDELYEIIKAGRLKEIFETDRFLDANTMAIMDVRPNPGICFLALSFPFDGIVNIIKFVRQNKLEPPKFKDEVMDKLNLRHYFEAYKRYR